MPSKAGFPVDAVLFDLDDTLYDQREWLDGAWRTVAQIGVPGIEEERFFDALRSVAAEGSDRGRIIDRALAALDRAAVPVTPYVTAFRNFRPSVLSPYPGVGDCLRELAAAVPLGLVTDGDPSLQASKLHALGMEPCFDVVIYSDELDGRSARKPAAAPFAAALGALGVVAENAVFVGDRPDKDVAGAVAAGMRAIRVLTGEYRGDESDPESWMTLASASEVAGALRPLLRRPLRSRPPIAPHG
jgi:putative hydrolase of the HAD superfamily